MNGPLDLDSLQSLLDYDIKRTKASIEFWRNQVRLQTDGPFDVAVVRTLDSYKTQLSGLIEAQSFLDSSKSNK